VSAEKGGNPVIPVGGSAKELEQQPGSKTERFYQKKVEKKGVDIFLASPQ